MGAVLLHDRRACCSVDRSVFVSLRSYCNCLSTWGIRPLTKKIKCLHDSNEQRLGVCMCIYIYTVFPVVDRAQIKDRA